MTKKDFLLKLLNSFDGRDLASSICVLIENDELNNKKIDAIYNIFLSVMKNREDNDKLEKSLNAINKIKNMENDENTMDQKLAENLLEEINKL